METAEGLGPRKIPGLANLGDPEVGDSIEVDGIRILDRGMPADITFFNRAIIAVQGQLRDARRIHRFCGTLGPNARPEPWPKCISETI